MRATWRWCAARIGGFPVVLASATPSVESRVNAQQGRYTRVALPSRFADAAMPDLGAIDMRRAPPARGGFLSPVLLAHIGDNLGRGEQSLLFLNRRGYAPLTLCRVCGHRFQCPDCSSWLVEHRFRGQLVCHHCGHHEKRPEACPECGTFDHLVACGPGVERIAEEVLGHFPEARTIVLSSDILGGVRRLRLELEAIAKGEADIVIGTQLVAKGHNFPNMTLVGVVDADLGLANGDPRAAERTFQLLSQVTGRAGRTGKKSIGLLQTYQPDHPVMRAIVSGDSESFLREGDRRAPDVASAAVRPACRHHRQRADAGRGGGACAGAAACRAAGRRPACARPRRSAAGAARRPPPLPAAGPGRAEIGHPVVHPRHACRRAEAARLGQGAGGYRPAEFSLVGWFAGKRCSSDVGGV